MTANLQFAWVWIFAGLLAGVVQGLFFHRDDWLGGYDSWPRRMVRLAHIAFFGTAFLNLFAAVTARLWLASPSPTLLAASSWLLMAGAITMSAVCYLAAWKKPLRHLFFIPVLGLLCGVGCLMTLVFEGVR